MTTARTELETFDLLSLPDLDTTVLGALELFIEQPVPEVTVPFKLPLIVGSGNAYATGKILFADSPAVFANESSYSNKLEVMSDIDGAVLISASGSKHAITIAETLQQKGIDSVLLTNNIDAPALNYFDESSVYFYPKNREPYTYNTSTYLGMILSKTKEDPEQILEYIETNVKPSLTLSFDSYNACTIIVPAAFGAITSMFRTKFDELFGPMITGRVFTEEEIKHAKTIVPSDKECFIGIGVADEWYGTDNHRISVPLPDTADYAALFAIGYFVIGTMQKQHPAYFKKNITAYTEKATAIFGHTIEPIVT